MAHFVRPLALAEMLDPREHEIHFYAPARYGRYLEGKPFACGELKSISGEEFLATLAKGKPLFSADTIRRYVAEERELIRQIRPDLIIGDMRLSLPISARLEGVRCAVLFNAYWSPYARDRFVIPSLPITRILPPRWFNPMFRIITPFVLRGHVEEMNRVRREFGLPVLPPDLRSVYTDGDYVLYPDIPEFVSTTNLPGNHCYVGICPWEPAAAKPEWWERMRADERRKVFVSLGSSGPVEVVPALLRALERLSVAPVIATSGRGGTWASRADLGVCPTNYLADLLPFTQTAAAVNVVVSHGGSGGLYPAMAAGTPVLAIPSNADQHMSTAVLVENGAGLGVRVEDANEKRLYSALEKLLGDPQFSRRAREWAEIYARYDSGAMFRKFLTEALATPRTAQPSDQLRQP